MSALISAWTSTATLAVGAHCLGLVTCQGLQKHEAQPLLFTYQVRVFWVVLQQRELCVLGMVLMPGLFRGMTW